MKNQCATLLIACLFPVLAHAQVEPWAGNWKTWVIASDREFRVPPPPDAASTQRELQWLRDVSSQDGRRIPGIVRFWDAGPPSYRWVDMVTERFMEGRLPGITGNRAYAYITMAIYDATIAAWESKYFYNRQRPSAADPSLKPKVDVPGSPSYPSDYAATAGAAATVLAYFFPDDARIFQEVAEEAARSRLFAGGRNAAARLSKCLSRKPPTHQNPVTSTSSRSTRLCSRSSSSTPAKAASSRCDTSRRVEWEHDNIRAAARHLIASGDVEWALRLGAAQQWF